MCIFITPYGPHHALCLVRTCDNQQKMNLLVFTKLLVVAIIFAPFVSAAEANIEACSPSNTSIEIDAQVPGVISTPVFPDGYAGSTCTWKIQAPNNFRLSITIEVLQLQGEDDHLVIRDGSSALTPLIGKYGPCASGSVTLFSSGNSAFLQTVSAVFSSKDQLRIRYRPTDPDDIDCSNQAENPPNFCSANTELTESFGILSSPNFPNNYDEDEYCLWSIVAPQGYRVQVNIKWFGIEEQRYSRHRCGDDSLKISESRGSETKDVKTLCGCEEQFSHVSYNEKMWLTFSSYKKANWPGFYATYQTLAPGECPAGNTNCPIKNVAPIGFNAQGQVCTIRVKTTLVTKTVLSPFLKPSYVGPSANESRLVLVTSPSVLLPLEASSLLASSMRFSGKVANQTLKKSILLVSPSGTPFPLPSRGSQARSDTSTLKRTPSEKSPAKIGIHALEKSTLMVSSLGTTISALSYMGSSFTTSSQAKDTSTFKRLSSEKSSSLQIAVGSSAETSSSTASFDEHIGFQSHNNIESGEIILDQEAKIEVVCRADYIEVTLKKVDFPGLIVDDSVLHLEDAGCGAGYKDDDIVKFTIGLEQCGTVTEDDRERINYSNNIYLTADEKSNDSSITRKHSEVIPFQCAYYKKITISKVSYGPRSTLVITNAEGYGNFTYEMYMYEDANMDIKVENFPKGVGLGQRMYFGFRVISADGGLYVFPDVCKATASPEYDSTPDHLIIENACSRDNTLDYNHQQSAEQSFSVSTFRFKENFDYVYVHCKLTVCRKTDTGSRCKRGCNETKRRRRSALEDDMSADLHTGLVSLNSMHLEAVAKQNSAAVESGNSSMVMMVAVLVGILGTVAVGLLVAVVIIGRRRRYGALNKDASFTVAEDIQTGQM